MAKKSVPPVSSMRQAFQPVNQTLKEAVEAAPDPAPPVPAPEAPPQEAPKPPETPISGLDTPPEDSKVDPASLEKQTALQDALQIARSQVAQLQGRVQEVQKRLDFLAVIPAAVCNTCPNWRAEAPRSASGECHQSPAGAHGQIHCNRESWCGQHPVLLAHHHMISTTHLSFIREAYDLREATAILQRLEKEVPSAST